MEIQILTKAIQDNEQIPRTLFGLRNSVYDGVFAHIFANLTGSMFLPAFALILGASTLHIGILAAAPFFATLAQFFGAFLVEKYHRRKRTTVIFAFLSRAIWIFVILSSLLLAKENPATLLLLLILFVISHHILASITGVAWLSWMAALVPEEIRGRFFGMRNSILGAFNIVFTILAGRFLDWYTRAEPRVSPTGGFELLFGFAVLCGMTSVVFLIRKPRPLEQVYALKLNLKKLYATPLKHRAFRKFAWFAAYWSLAIKIAAPFFIVYMLQELHFDYTFIALLVVSSAFADMAGMWIWGQFSDRLGNKPVLMISSIFISIIPLLWFFSRADLPYIHLLIILLHLISGFFWAGFNLCSVNLVFAMAPKERNTGFFAWWAAFNGLASGLGAILGGVLAKFLPDLLSSFDLFSAFEFKAIFLLSALLRFTSILLLRKVTDPKGRKMSRVIRILRNVKTWAGLMGFDAILHYFLPEKKTRKRGKSPYWPIWRADRRNYPGEDGVSV